MKKIAILVVTILGSQGLVWSAHAASYKLLFSSNRTGSNSYDLYTMDPDGTGLLRITNFSGGERPSNQSVANGRIVYMRGGYANRTSSRSR